MIVDAVSEMLVNLVLCLIAIINMHRIYFTQELPVSVDGTSANESVKGTYLVHNSSVGGQTLEDSVFIHLICRGRWWILARKSQRKGCPVSERYGVPQGNRVPRPKTLVIWGPTGRMPLERWGLEGPRTASVLGTLW